MEPKMSKKIQNTATETVLETTTEVVQPAATEKKAIPYVLADLMTELKTKSAVVRKLAAEEFSRGDIAKFMNIRYQHVRNILVTPIKKG